MLSRFHPIPGRYGRTNGRTDRIAISISRVSVLTRDNDVMSIFKISAILDFRGPIMGSLKSPCTTFYRSSIDTIALYCLVFKKKLLFAFWHQDIKIQDGGQC